MAVTMYQKRLASRRRNSDITRLADVYQQQVAGITGEYEKAFGQFEAETKKKTDAYDAAIKKYQGEVSAYQAKVSDYNTNVLGTYQKQLDAYNKKLDSYYGSFVQGSSADTYATYAVGGKGNILQNVENPGGDFYGMGTIYQNPSLMFTKDPGSGLYLRRQNPTESRNLIWENVGVYHNRYRDPVTNQVFWEYKGKGGRPINWDQRAGPNFYITGGTSFGSPATVHYFPDEPNKDQAPAKPAAFSAAAPVAPQSPTLGTFDDTPFQEQRQQAEATYKRELSERRASRLSAVQRRASRPLLRSS